MLIVDLEATCSDDPDWDRNLMEIIQIGAVIVDPAGHVVSTYDAFAKPSLTTELTPFCTKLTGITQAQISNAAPLKEVLQSFEAWCDKNINFFGGYWGSWGNYDHKQFKKDSRRQGLGVFDLIDIYDHYNLKQMWADATKQRPCGLGRAIQFEGLKFEGRAHNALVDARNIARLPTIKKIIKGLYE